jgi:8-oxo-dGTP pyrophosphatase MutT (NUDIX family)
MINLTEISRVTERYLELYPEDHDDLKPLLDGLAEPTDITARSTFTGHVTASAIVLGPRCEMLHIRHKTLQRWLQPGGHLEPADTSLPEAALREVHEETGIEPGFLVPLGPLPVDIDVHEIPANDKRGEPVHYHFDFRYAFTLRRAAEITLQEEEVTGHAWFPLQEAEPVVWERLCAAPLTRVLAGIAGERQAQDARWGIQEFPDGTSAALAPAAELAKEQVGRAYQAGGLTWREILAEEVAEAFAETDPELLRAELVQVAAVAAKWIQAIDRRHPTARPPSA